MIFEELFQIQVGVGLVRAARSGVLKDRKLRIGDEVRSAIKKILPFHPTGAQKRVLKEIADDMCSPRPMSRLLQGDVGSRKTIVAPQAAILAVESGFQAAIMAPTEILAEQHYRNLGELFEQVNAQGVPHPLNARLLTGSTPPSEREIILAEIANGRANIVVGTHALIQEAVSFNDLALAVIDEQHRFGVAQRAMLRQKGTNPHVLVMTATPIPRTLVL